MITYREYAEKHHAKPNTIQKTVARNPEKFKGHVHEKNRVKYLDEEGERILDEMRQGNPTVVINENKSQQIDELNDTISKLKDTIITLQATHKQELEDLRDKYDLLNDKYILMLEEKTQAAEEDPDADQEEQPEEVSEQVTEEQPQAESVGIIQNTANDEQKQPKATFKQRLSFFLHGKL